MQDAQWSGVTLRKAASISLSILKPSLFTRQVNLERLNSAFTFENVASIGLNYGEYATFSILVILKPIKACLTSHVRCTANWSMNIVIRWLAPSFRWSLFRYLRKSWAVIAWLWIRMRQKPRSDMQAITLRYPRYTSYWSTVWFEFRWL